MTIPTTSKASYTNGHWLIHDDGTNLIQIWCSSFTGKEKIYLNGELITQSYIKNLPSVHEFIDKPGSRYKINIHQPTFTKSSLECTIEREGTVIKTFKVKREPRKSFLSKSFLFTIVGAAILGGLQSFYGFSNLIFITFLIIALIAGLVLDPVKAIIEE